MIALQILDNNKFVDVGFGLWLIPRIRAKLISNIDSKKLKRWDEYLNTSDSLRRLYDKEYKAQDIIIFAAKNLICKGVAGNILIQINPVIFVPGFDRLKLETICKTINFGTLDTKGVPIFTETLNYFSENIDANVGTYFHTEV